LCVVITGFYGKSSVLATAPRRADAVADGPTMLMICQHMLRRLVWPYHIEYIWFFMPDDAPDIANKLLKDDLLEKLVSVEKERRRVDYFVRLIGEGLRKLSYRNLTAWSDPELNEGEMKIVDYEFGLVHHEIDCLLIGNCLCPAKLPDILELYAKTKANAKEDMTRKKARPSC
jgi:hypothetical protein